MAIPITWNLLVIGISVSTRYPIVWEYTVRVCIVRGVFVLLICEVLSA